MKHIIVAGGGTAAFESAVSARKTDPECRITIYSKEDVLPYRRPALSALAANDEEPSGTFFIRNEEFYRDSKIEFNPGVAVTRIDAENHIVRLSNGGFDHYDALIIATGAAARRIAVPGADGSNVFVLREYSDLMKLRAFLGSKALRVAIIGGGVLGLELADSLLKRSCRVTVVEGAERLLPRNLDPAAGEYVMKQLTGVKNLEILPGKELKEITPESVVLADRILECDCVIFSVGSASVIPDCANLTISRGVEVDSNMRTNLPDIFAAGDVALFGGVPCGLFTTASKMGQVAGCCAAGGEAEFTLTSNPVRLNALGLKLFSIGTIDEKLKNDLQITPGGFSRIFYDQDGKVAGAVLIGDVSSAMKLQKLINS